ncbi:hypothetical protein [Bacillus sp. JCM 19034]|uniref:hypothetical protein n=1 Tax=Bacillus sp. JCM 19034 TaxID=1481928 RepID=UPI000780F2CB|nr:hypothetical protein [Bacillus sp. JCM 19034]
MRNSFIDVEFTNIQIKLSKPALHQFIKRMMNEHYSLYWRYDSKTIYLMIERDESVHELPFLRNTEFLTLSAESLYINDEGLASALESLLQHEKGTGIVKRSTDGPLYIISYQSGDIESMIEIDGSEKVMMNQNGSMIHYKGNDKSLNAKTIYNVMNLEIDYVLMELHEAMKCSNKEMVEVHKRKLKQLLSRREQVEQLL